MIFYACCEKKTKADWTPCCLKTCRILRIAQKCKPNRAYFLRLKLSVWGFKLKIIHTFTFIIFRLKLLHYPGFYVPSAFSAHPIKRFLKYISKQILVSFMFPSGNKNELYRVNNAIHFWHCTLTACSCSELKVQRECE